MGFGLRLGCSLSILRSVTHCGDTRLRVVSQPPAEKKR